MSVRFYRVVGFDAPHEIRSAVVRLLWNSHISLQGFLDALRCVWWICRSISICSICAYLFVSRRLRWPWLYCSGCNFLLHNKSIGCMTSLDVNFFLGVQFVDVVGRRTWYVRIVLRVATNLDLFRNVSVRLSCRSPYRFPFFFEFSVVRVSSDRIYVSCIADSCAASYRRERAARLYYIWPTSHSLFLLYPFVSIILFWLVSLRILSFRCLFAHFACCMVSHGFILGDILSDRQDADLP